MKLCFALLLAVIVTSACKDDKKNVDDVHYDLFPTTRELSTADLETISEDRADGTLTFTPAPSSLADIEAGMVVIGGASSKTPFGLIRGVGEVTRNGNSLTLRTAVVPPQLAFKRLSIHSAHEVPNLDGFTVRTDTQGPLTELQLKALGGSVTGEKEVRWVLFDGDNDETTEDDQVRVDGALGGGFDYDMHFDIDWGAVDGLPDAVTGCLKSLKDIIQGDLPDCTPTSILPEAKATFDVRPKLTTRADLTGSASLEFEKKVPILQTTGAPIPVGPIVLVPSVDVVATLDGSAGAHFQTGFDAEFEGQIVVTASSKTGSKVSEPKLTKHDFNPHPTELAISAGAGVKLGARLAVSAYGIAGPYAEANGFARIEADTSKEPCWSLSGGVSAQAGLELTTPKLPVIGYLSLFDISTPSFDLFNVNGIATGTCSAAPGTPLPGAGPSEQSYGSPSFATWSSVSPLTGDASVTPSSLGADLAFTNVLRSTDGRFVLAANGSEHLTKLDETGAVTWTRGLAHDLMPYAVGRVAVLRDASIIIASSDAGDPAVLRVGESANIGGGRAYNLDAACPAGRILAVQALPPTGDPDGPAYVFTGECTGADTAYLVTAKADGTVAKAVTLAADARISPRALAVVGSSIWWLGTYEPAATTHVAAVRFDLDLAQQAASAYLGSCIDNQTVEPAFATGAILREELLVVGSSSGQHEGLFMRLKPDASVAIATFPSYGPGASDVGVLHAIAELPTGGYVVAGSHVDLVALGDGSPEEYLAPFLSWLDAAGSVLAAKRFRMGDGHTPAGAPQFALTNDGGLIMGSTRNATVGSHELWAMKVFAKDGTVSDPNITVTDFPFQAAVCGMAQVGLTIGVTPVAVATRTINVN